MILEELEHVPLFIDNEVGKIGFMSLAAWLSKQNDAVLDFQKETGISFPKTKLDQLIDEATGNDMQIAKAWLNYVSRWHWGCACHHEPTEEAA